MKHITKPQLTKEVVNVELRERILNCSTPEELASEFSLKLINTVSYLTEDKEERQSYAIEITSLLDENIILMAADLLKIEGEIKEAKRQEEESYSTLSGYYSGIEQYKKWRRSDFEERFTYQNKRIMEIYFLESIKKMDCMEDIETAVHEYNDIEAGFYDCDGILQIPKISLDGNFTNYTYKDYSYQLVYVFNYKYNFSSHQGTKRYK